MTEINVEFIFRNKTDSYMRYAQASLNKELKYYSFRDDPITKLGIISIRGDNNFKRVYSVDNGINVIQASTSSPKGYDWEVTIKINDKEIVTGMCNGHNPVEARFMVIGPLLVPVPAPAKPGAVKMSAFQLIKRKLKIFG